MQQKQDGGCAEGFGEARRGPGYRQRGATPAPPPPDGQRPRGVWQWPAAPKTARLETRPESKFSRPFRANWSPSDGYSLRMSVVAARGELAGLGPSDGRTQRRLQHFSIAGGRPCSCQYRSARPLKLTPLPRYQDPVLPLNSSAWALQTGIDVYIHTEQQSINEQ